MPDLLARLLVLASAFALTACGDAEDHAVKDSTLDPAVSGALADQIMVDPDLAGQNRGNAALGGGGPADGSLPPEDSTPESIVAAKADAALLVGGQLRVAPAPASSTPGSDVALLTAADVALSIPGIGTACPKKIEYSAAWAAKMPATFPVYPRGHVNEAAGTDRDGCRLRVINFVTPVAPADIIDFYYTRALSAGFTARRTREGSDDVLGGTRGGAAYAVHARLLPNGLAEVDLVVNGG